MKKRILNVKLGDAVVISASSSAKRSATTERMSTVSAVRSKSFDAGGLCFRNDGKEWRGRHRAYLTAQTQEVSERNHLENPLLELSGEERSREEQRQIEQAKRKTENAILAYLLTFRQENEWLRLSLRELRRIAALHGITVKKRTRARTSASRVQPINALPDSLDRSGQKHQPAPASNNAQVFGGKVFNFEHLQ
jgi:hypothetical protein